MTKFIIFLIVLTALTIFKIQALSTCLRCICPCTNAYCRSDNTNTWNSSYAYSNYGYTKLVLALDNSSCQPCAYSCMVCTSQYDNNCTTCMTSFYLSSSFNCMLCGDHCSVCSLVNNITICTSCLSGTYLDNYGICRNCPNGANNCDSVQIYSCLIGYYQVSPIVCLTCSSYCQTCTSSQCTLCNTGYYKNSVGNCIACNVNLNCLSCTTNTTCGSCLSGYYLTNNNPRICVKCSAGNCSTCSSSSSSTCILCLSGYYLSAGSCLIISNIVLNCMTYSGNNICINCISSYYLLNNQCLPCSMNCLTCYSGDFGSCYTCASGYTLFNLMCLPSNFITNNSYKLYFHLPSFTRFFSGGTISTCSESVYTGIKVNFLLQYLASSFVTVKWKIYLLDTNNGTYQVNFNSNDTSTATTFISSNTLNSICSNTLPEKFDINSETFTNILLTNTLTFSTQTVTLAISQITLLCIRCSSLCLVCTSTVCSKCINNNLFTQADSCVYSCSNSYYTYQKNYTCLSICPQSTYTINSNLTCMDCVSPCYTCNTSISCTSCTNPYFLLNNTCTISCPSLYYANNISQTCQKCEGRCLTCLSSTMCLTCNIGFLYNYTCLDNCSSIASYYSDLSTLKCLLCNPNCLNCTNSSTICISCPSSIPYLINRTCFSTCPFKFYSSNNSICLSCIYPCYNCSKASNNCTSCLIDYLYNNSCVSQCPDGFYAEISIAKCISCSLGCSKCAYTQIYCQQCIIGYYYFNSNCNITCPATYYPNNSNQICSLCINPCLTCTNSTFCLSCISNFLISNLGTCVTANSCPYGYYADINTLVCLICTGNCTSCYISATLCTSCLSPYLLQLGACVLICSQYLYKVNNSCLPCTSPCLTCSINSTNCNSCLPGYLYSNLTNQCLNYCIEGTYISIINNNVSCISCGTNCLSCFQANNCLSCSYKNFLYPLNGICVSNCTAVNNTYYSDQITNYCLVCIAPCLTCQSIVQCTSCINGVLYSYSCLVSCPIMTYQSGSTCLNCSNNCLECQNSSINCTSCLSGYLYNYSCYSTCPNGYYGNPTLKYCSMCPINCATCTNITFCTSCSIGYLDSNNNCVNSCPFGFYANIQNQTCSLCDSTCLGCIFTSTNCISCSNQYYLIELTLNTSICQSECYNNQYLSNKICYNCTSPCYTCSSSIICIICINGTYLYNGSCLTSCPVSTFESANTCANCNIICKTCLNASYCLTCSNSSLYISNGICVQQCSNLYYADSLLKICELCTGLCLSCSSKYLCLTCIQGYLLNGYCYIMCPPGTFSNNNTQICDTCSSPCLTCVQNSKNCLRCITGYYVYFGMCYSQCPSSSYLINQTCISCDYPCLTCINQGVCQSCLGSFLLYLNTSCIAGPICPNNMYNLNGTQCIRLNECPQNYFIDSTKFTCSSSCNLGRYTYSVNHSCLSTCPQNYFVSINLICQSFENLNNKILLGMTYISFITSSVLYIELVFNQTVTWNYPVTESTYLIQQTLFNRLLLNNKIQNISYGTTSFPNLLYLYDSTQINLYLPAYYVSSSQNQLPLQTTQITITPHVFMNYTYENRATASVIGQISQSASWTIIFISLGFFFINKLSDIYIIWDVTQLFYLLLYLDIQYPPNLNQFLLGLKPIHLYFFPNIFSIPQQSRQISPSSYYAYSYDVNFLRSSGHNITIFLIFISIYLILKSIQILVQKLKIFANNNVRKIVFKGILRYRWHYTNDFFFITFTNVMSYCIAQLSWDTNAYYLYQVNFLIISVCVVSYLTFPIFVGSKLYRHYRNISQGKLVGNLKCFYRGIQKTNKFGISLILLRFLRKIIYCISIPLLSTKPLFAMPILTFSSFLFGLFILINRPFKIRISNAINIFTEFSIVTILLLISILQFQAGIWSSNINWIIGWICIILLMAIIFGQIFYIFCKTLFYMEPEKEEKEGSEKDSQKIKKINEILKDEKLVRQKANEFFNKLFPNLKLKLLENFSSDEDDSHQYEEGDSANSENNQFFKQQMNIIEESENSEHFKHYESGSETNQELVAPKYLIKCVNTIQQKI